MAAASLCHILESAPASSGASLLPLLEGGLSKDGVRLGPRSVSQSSLWGSSIHSEPRHFHLASAIDSLQMQMLPGRTRCRRRQKWGGGAVIVSRRLRLFSAVTRHRRRLDGLHGQRVYLRMRAVLQRAEERELRLEEIQKELMLLRRKRQQV